MLRARNVPDFAYLNVLNLTAAHWVGRGGNAHTGRNRPEQSSRRRCEKPDLFLQDFDHLVVRQVPDIELQRDVDPTDESRLQPRTGSRGGCRSAEVVSQERAAV